MQLATGLSNVTIDTKAPTESEARVRDLHSRRSAYSTNQTIEVANRCVNATWACMGRTATYSLPAQVSCHLAIQCLWATLGHAQGCTSGSSGLHPSKQMKHTSSSNSDVAHSVAIFRYQFNKLYRKLITSTLLDFGFVRLRENREWL